MRLTQHFLQNLKNEDFHNATLEDINYEKEVHEHEEWLDRGQIDKSKLTMYFLIAIAIVLAAIIINYFYPFIK